MSKFLKFPKTLLSACALAAGLASGAASAQGVFTVNEAVVPGAVPNIVTADRITFGYQARIIQTINGGSLAGADDPFTENGFLSKGSFELGAGNSVSSQLNGLELSGGYRIYGVFTITGEADPGGLPGEIRADFSDATLTLFVDPLSNTTLGFNGSNEVTTGNAGDDVALANFSLIVGEANVRAGLANGDFDTFLNILPTAFGSTFFASPVPFFPVENFGGNTETITGASLTTSFVATATGAGVELFLNVPEPATLSMVGLALVGLGAASRRQKKSS